MSDKLRPVWKDGIETCKHGGWVGWCVRCKDEQIAALKSAVVGLLRLCEETTNERGLLYIYPYSSEIVEAKQVLALLTAEEQE